jgi:hypothetical protein
MDHFPNSGAIIVVSNTFVYVLSLLPTMHMVVNKATITDIREADFSFSAVE